MGLLATPSVNGIRHNDTCHTSIDCSYAECHYAECHDYLYVMPTVVMQNFIVLIVIMMNVIMLSVVMLNVIMPSVIMLSIMVPARVQGPILKKLLIAAINSVPL
jgi:hypothetical protein